MGARAARKQRGASTIVLILVLAFFVILPLAIFVFETSRYLLIADQLRSVTDAAALSGTAAMASAPTGTNAQRQLIAMQAAYATFEQNSVLQTAFNKGNVTVNYNPASPKPQSPSLHNAALNIILLDQTGKPVVTGNPASTMQIQSWYTDAPLFTYKFVPLGTQYTASAVSNGGLPMLDVILCFDVSGSMDDQTNVILVDRYWDGTRVQYGKQAGWPTATSIYNIFTPPPTGTGFNIYPPQNLSYASYADGGVKSNTVAYQWSESPAPYNSYNGLRSNTNPKYYPAGPSTAPEQGMPPGNYDPTNTTSRLINGNDPTPPGAGGTFTGFTDVVINPGSFPLTTGGVTFPTLESLVEGARGNLETVAALNSATPGLRSNYAGLFPAATGGYLSAYWNYVMNNAQPITAARAAAYTFFTTMNLSANSHFGMVTFSDAAGTSSNGVWTGASANNKNLDSNYASGGLNSWSGSGFPMPLIALDPNNSNFTNVLTALDGNVGATPNLSALVPEGETDIGDSLNTALTELTQKSPQLFRTGAKKAIILFTDGVPNQPTGGGGPTGTAKTAATNAGKNGIPIYTIGLSQVPAIQGPENALLGTSGGIAGLSGNNAIYVPVTNNAQLDTAFQTIARSLCVLQ